MSVQEWLSGLLSPSGVWSLGTMAVSVWGLLLQRWNQKWSWVWGIGAQCVWIAGGVALQRPGDIILSVIFASLYVHLLWHHRARDFRREHTDLAAAKAEVEKLRAELAECRALTPVGAR